MTDHTDQSETAEAPSPSKKPEGSRESTRGRLAAAVRELIEPFRALGQTSRSLFGVYFSYVLEGMVYFGILTILGKYLSENVGLKDLHAGWVYSLFTGGITLAMLFLGGVSDRIGVRRALLISITALVLGRLLLAASGTFFAQGQGAGSAMFVMVVVGLFVVVLGYGMYQPASYAAVKQLTSGKQATMAFAMIYGLMNLGAFFSGLLSPLVRQRLGIGAVFWAYFGFVLVALLAVYVLMTRRAMAKDTVTDISEKKKTTEEGEAQDATPRKPLFTPSYMALVGGLAVAVIAVLALAILADPGPTADSLDQVKSRLKAAGRVLDLPEKQHTESGLREAGVLANLAQHRVRLRETAPKIHVPEKLPQGTLVDKETFQALRLFVEAEADLLSRATADATALVMTVPLGTPEAKAARAELRAHGVYALAVAYRLVGRVDQTLVDRIQRQQSTSRERGIPLPAPLRQRILSVTRLDTEPMVLALAEDTEALAMQLERSLGPGGVALARLLQAEAALFRQILKVAAPPWPASLNTLLVQRYYHFGTMLIKNLAPALDSEKPEGKPVALGMLASRLALGAGFTEPMKEAADAAVHVPLAERLSRWGLRYGVLMVVIVFLVVFALVVLLKRRPDHPFRDGRFVFFIFALIPVQTLFAHNWLTLPYYIDRAFGGTYVGENFELFSNINPLLIFVLAPFVAALTARRAIYSMMIWGTLVMALPTFLLVLTPNPVLLLTYILLMSVGEAMWQPRFLQWVAEIAPEGKTGAYMGIAQFPWFLTKVVTGMYSGYFLAKHCPLVGPQSTEALWLIYALTAMASPVALVAARRWMLKGMQG